MSSGRLRLTAALVLTALTMSLPAAPPKVVKAVPDDGETSVDPDLKQLRVVFDQPMAPGGYSVVGGGPSFPEVTGTGQWEDDHTFVLPWQLDSGHNYWLSINSSSFTNFRGTNGAPAVPHPIEFRTASTEPEKPREQRWNEDIDYLATELPKRHKDFSRLFSKQQFEASIASLKQNITRLSDAELAIGLTRIVASAGVAHTQLDWQSRWLGLHAYPVELRWFSDGLFITAATTEYRDLLGLRVAKLGPQTPEEALAAISPYLAHENVAWLRHQSPTYLRWVELMQHAKCADEQGQLTLAATNPGGATVTRSIRPVKWFDRSESGRMYRVLELTNPPTPLYLKHPRSFYWRELIPASGTLYVQFNKCADDPRQPFADFAAATLADLDSNQVSRLIVDLRFNSGGNSEVIRPLLRGLRNRVRFSTQGSTCVLIGERTFSSGLMDAIYVQDQLKAVLVGAATGGKPNCYGEVRSFALPNSRLNVSYCVKRFVPISDADPESLEPDVAVDFTFKDYVSGRDPVLEAAVRRLEH